MTVIDHKAQPNAGPHHCSPTCIVLNSETLELEYRFDYCMYGHFMKFIERWAVRIGSTSSKSLPNVAFKNPDGSIVLVVANPGRNAQELSISYKKLGFGAQLTPESIATFIWSRQVRL
ncbi:MAG: hypothetical protein JSW59_02155 [Phycisphaerales bacterium]|nr:MAG: hypothetical protein JSW59_02155 [Phycisphaerales bacterium]